MSNNGAHNPFNKSKFGGRGRGFSKKFNPWKSFPAKNSYPSKVSYFNERCEFILDFNWKKKNWKFEILKLNTKEKN